MDNMGSCPPPKSNTNMGLKDYNAKKMENSSSLVSRSYGSVIQPQNLYSLMELPNQVWTETHKRLSDLMPMSPKWPPIKGDDLRNLNKSEEVAKSLLKILQINTIVARALGAQFRSQIDLIFPQMVDVYKKCSEVVSTTTTKKKAFARSSYVKLMRSVKRETLRVIEAYLDNDEAQQQMEDKLFVSQVMDLVLNDYALNFSDNRESEVLSLCAVIINRYKGAIIDDDDVRRIYKAVFECTLEMITKNAKEYPEHRLKLYSLLSAIATHGVEALSSENLKIVMDSIMWAFRQTERNIAETMPDLLLILLKNLKTSQYCNDLYRDYFLPILVQVFKVVTNMPHTHGFKAYVKVLNDLFFMVHSRDLDVTICERTTIQQEITSLLHGYSPKISDSKVTEFVNGLFNKSDNLSNFENHTRDFLVQSEKFSTQNLKDMFPEEEA